MQGFLFCGVWRRGVSTLVTRLLVARPVGAIFGGFVVVSALAFDATAAYARPSFQQFLNELWPDAQRAGVSRKTFDTAFRGVKPNLRLPDLVLPGRKTDGSKGQAEFTRPPSRYVNRSYLQTLARQGRRYLKTQKNALDKIERELGVDRYSVLAIWGRETAFGKHKLRHDAIRVLATQAYVGRRKDMFREELIAALKMLEVGVPRKRMRSSWAGAMGLTQFMPSEYFTHTYDLDGDGKTDIWTSIPDALGSAARQLQGKGWVARQTWGYEVKLTRNVNCSFEGPTQERPISEWAELGLKRANGKAWSAKQLRLRAYMMSPAGAYGPSFLVLENFKVIRRYNTSDLYALFVGHLADRIAGLGDFVTPWGKSGRQRTRVIREVQERLQRAGYDVSKIDGKIGSNTRRVVGGYQRANGVKVDCWPSQRVLKEMRALGGAIVGPKTAARQ